MGIAGSQGDLPDGLSDDSPVQPLPQKYPASRLTQINSISPAVPFLRRGGSRSSRTRDGMRWTWMAPKTRALLADGEVVWS
jgi:hypothetical protein